MSRTFLLNATLICTATILLTGCTASKDKETKPETEEKVAQSTDPHDHEAPESYAAGVEMLKEHYEEIKVAFEADKPDDAHAPLHCVGDLLGALPDLAAKAEMADDKAEEVKLAVAALFDAYGQVDDAMHHDEEPDYAAVAETIDTNMAVLEKAASDQS